MKLPESYRKSNPNLEVSDKAPLLCRSCWQASIMEERKTKVSRLKNYRRRHPAGAQEQCNGKTWW